VTLGLARGSRYNDPERYLEVLGRDLPAIAIDGRKGTRSARIRSLRRVIRQTRPDVVLSMRLFDAYEATVLEKTRGSGPRLAVGVRSFEAPYLEDLALYRDSVDLCVTSGELIAAAAVRQSGMDPKRVVSIGGGVHPPRRELRIRRAVRPMRLLYAGRLDGDQKRIFDLPRFLDALEARGVPFELHIAGVGPAEEDLRVALAKRIEAGSVLMHGWVSQAQLYERLYPDSDCFVHFAAWEGMTIAPREAMAHGVVPVISRFPGLRLEGQFVDCESALTFPVGDVAAAAACVERLASEPGLLPRLSARAAESQDGIRSFEGSMDAWAEALQDCLRLPLMRGRTPDVPYRATGRLSRLGLTGRIQDHMRDLLGRRVQHRSPGSEWPTSSGLTGQGTRDDLQRLALELDGVADIG
jgi:glycosyltransferase involved in cell wall biosynthesis